jgi:serine/threonine protein kinase
MAPRLLYCGPVDGRPSIEGAPEQKTDTKDAFGLHLDPLRMVVMEHIDGTNGEDLKADERPQDTYTQLRAMIQTLHDSSYVFGDLRPPNVMFSGTKVFLIDFDWAGKEGEVFYPTQLGEGITQHCEGRDLELIKKEHDLALLDHYFPSV